MKIKIYNNDKLESEIEHSTRQENAVRNDIAMRQQNGENVRYEIYTPEPEYTLQELQDQKIAQIKAECTQRIYAAGATEHKQRNIGMGLITGEEAAQIVDIVVTHRGVCNAIENEVKIAESEKEIDMIIQEAVWP